MVDYSDDVMIKALALLDNHPHCLNEPLTSGYNESLCLNYP